MSRKLHIGGKQKSPDWEILDIIPNPYVNHVCNARDLSQFESNTFAVIYASHVLEHFDYNNELPSALREWYRVLKPGGKIYISVPDLDILAQLFILKEQLTVNDRFAIMRMIFGGHLNKYDFHLVGLNEEFLAALLKQIGFITICKVDRFNIFDDDSNLSFQGVHISLNMIAEKPIEEV